MTVDIGMRMFRDASYLPMLNLPENHQYIPSSNIVYITDMTVDIGLRMFRDASFLPMLNLPENHQLDDSTSEKWRSLITDMLRYDPKKRPTIQEVHCRIKLNNGMYDAIHFMHTRHLKQTDTTNSAWQCFHLLKQSAV